MSDIVVMPEGGYRKPTGKNQLQRFADTIAGVPNSRAQVTLKATPTTINPENTVARERVFSVTMQSSDAAGKVYLFFDQIGLVENNNGTPLTPALQNTGSTYGTAEVGPITKAMSVVPFRLQGMRITMPSSVTTFPGRIQLVKTDFTGSIDPIPLDEAANSNPFYDQGNVLDLRGLNFLIDPYRAVRIDLDQTVAAENYKVTFYVSQLANNYMMKNL